MRLTHGEVICSRTPPGISRAASSRRSDLWPGELAAGQQASAEVHQATSTSTRRPAPAVAPLTGLAEADQATSASTTRPAPAAAPSTTSEAPQYQQASAEVHRTTSASTSTAYVRQGIMEAGSMYTRSALFLSSDKPTMANFPSDNTSVPCPPLQNILCPPAKQSVVKSII